MADEHNYPLMQDYHKHMVPALNILADVVGLDRNRLITGMAKAQDCVTLIAMCNEIATQFSRPQLYFSMGPLFTSTSREICGLSIFFFVDRAQFMAISQLHDNTQAEFPSVLLSTKAGESTIAPEAFEAAVKKMSYLQTKALHAALTAYPSKPMTDTEHARQNTLLMLNFTDRMTYKIPATIQAPLLNAFAIVDALEAEPFLSEAFKGLMEKQAPIRDMDELFMGSVKKLWYRKYSCIDEVQELGALRMTHRVHEKHHLLMTVENDSMELDFGFLQVLVSGTAVFTFNEDSYCNQVLSLPEEQSALIRDACCHVLNALTNILTGEEKSACVMALSFIQNIDGCQVV